MNKNSLFVLTDVWNTKHPFGFWSSLTRESVLASARPLAEQKIVITGASSGIGLQTAKQAVAQGAEVLLVSRNAEALAQIVEEIGAGAGSAVFHAADVGDAEAMKAAAQAAVDRFGRIDTWINCAGVAIYGKLVDIPFDEHERLFRTNYFGVVNGAQAALPYLERSGGTLITIASIASDIPSPILGAYAASKHAVKAYIESLRIELTTAGSAVTITLVKPSGVDTPIGQHAANHMGAEALIPPPVYDPSIVADTILDLIEHPRREITIGGAGRANVLLGEHFPRALQHLSRFFSPLLTDSGRPPTSRNNLFQPGDDKRVRSGVEQGRAFSLYTVAARHRTVTALSVAGLAAAAFAVRRARLSAGSRSA